MEISFILKYENQFHLTKTKWRGQSLFGLHFRTFLYFAVIFVIKQEQNYNIIILMCFHAFIFYMQEMKKKKKKKNRNRYLLPNLSLYLQY